MTDNSTAPLLPSAPFDTRTDHRSLLDVIAWLFTIISLMVVATRCGTRWAVSRIFALDDAFIIISLLFAIGSTIAITLGVKNGLGLLGWGNGSQDELDALQKSVFSFNILFILSQVFSKLSILVFIRSLTPSRLHRNLGTLLIILAVSWGITAGFGLAFQCNTPQTWNSLRNECMNRLAFFTCVEIFNILLDLVLMLLPILVIWNLKLSLNPKLVVISCFVPRICVIIAITAQLAILYDEDQSREPFFFWSFIMSTLLAQCLGIVSACILYLKPFLKSLNSGMMRNDDLRRREETNLGSSHMKYASKTKAISKKKISKLLSSVTDISSTTTIAKDGNFPPNLKGIPLNDYPMRKDLSNDHQVSVVVAQPGTNEWEATSQSSRSNMIRQTKTSTATSIHTDDQVYRGNGNDKLVLK